MGSRTHLKRQAARERRARIARQKRYNLTPKGRFRQHKANSKRRGVEFLLTFAEWFELWEPFLDAHGQVDNGYAMARNGDEGPYAVGNVSIKLHGENVAERNRRYFAARRWGHIEQNDDYQHVHSAPGVDSSRFNGEPGPDVPF